MMLTGILFISICVGCYRLSAFGVDAFTCMNLGISGFLGMSFGTWQLIMNGCILIVVFLTVRKCIGAGTIVNMVFVGYGADFICWLTQEALRIHMSLPMRIVALAIGCLFAGLGVAFYMAAEMGIAPYDSVALIIEKGTKGKIPFQYARHLPNCRPSSRDTNNRDNSPTRVRHYSNRGNNKYLLRSLPVGRGRRRLY